MPSLSRVILAIAGLVTLAAIFLPPAPTGARKAVRPFLVYYGGIPRPGTQAQAAALARRMRGYPVVVLGLVPSAPAFAERVRRLLPHTVIYGYADMGHVTFAHVAARLRLLRRVGLDGVLLDEVGTGLSSRPAALRRIVLLAQRDGLRVMLNAWDPRDTLNLPLRPGRDAVLCENWVYSGGAWAEPRTAAVYAALRTLERRGVLVFMIVTTSGVPSRTAPPLSGISATARAVFGNYLALSDPVYSADNDAIFPGQKLGRELSRLSF